MELNLVRDLLSEVRPGAFTNLIYTIDCPVKAEFKKQGIKVRKTVRTNVRFKINYSNIKSVREKGYKESSRKNNFVAIEHNSLYHNTNTGKDYLNVYPFKNSRTKNLYEVHMPFYGEDVWYIFPEEEIRENGLLIESYFNKKATSMYRINVENIFSIKGRWA